MDTPVSDDLWPPPAVTQPAWNRPPVWVSFLFLSAGCRKPPKYKSYRRKSSESVSVDSLSSWGKNTAATATWRVYKVIKKWLVLGFESQRGSSEVFSKWLQQCKRRRYGREKKKRHTHAHSRACVRCSVVTQWVKTTRLPLKPFLPSVPLLSHSHSCGFSGGETSWLGKWDSVSPASPQAINHRRQPPQPRLAATSNG